MGSWTKLLAALSAALLLLGIGTLASQLDSITLVALQDSVASHARVVFAGAAWRWLVTLAGGSLAVAAVLTIVDTVLSVRRPPRSPTFSEMSGSTLEEALSQTQRRVLQCAEGEANIVALFDELLRGAVRTRSSDIHISPNQDGVRLTLRVEGTLHEVAVVPPAIAPLLATRVKVMARLDTVAKSPQDGRLVTYLDAGAIEARVSTLPTENGERVVLRIVRGSRDVFDLPGLGFAPDFQKRLEAVLARPQGLIFVTGPVGSGKTTTLYACLKHIARTRSKTTALVTLEDPIELELPFATQTQMNQKAGMNFASVLRSVLRQDPNVLMVGEIRDHETAEIAMQAGLTGHLILTTVHGNSAAGVFARLIDIGVEPFVLASATAGCLSQRLLRTLCTACRKETKPEAMIEDRFSQAGVVVPPGTYYEAIGCDFCDDQGFVGRAPIAELLIMDEALRKAVHDRSPTTEIEAVAQTEGMVSLLRDGLRVARAGDTSLAEVLRVAG